MLSNKDMRSVRKQERQIGRTLKNEKRAAALADPNSKESKLMKLGNMMQQAAADKPPAPAPMYDFPVDDLRSYMQAPQMGSPIDRLQRQRIGR